MKIKAHGCRRNDVYLSQYRRNVKKKISRSLYEMTGWEISVYKCSRSWRRRNCENTGAKRNSSASEKTLATVTSLQPSAAIEMACWRKRCRYLHATIASAAVMWREESEEIFEEMKYVREEKAKYRRSERRSSIWRRRRLESGRNSCLSINRKRKYEMAKTRRESWLFIEGEEGRSCLNIGEEEKTIHRRREEKWRDRRRKTVYLLQEEEGLCRKEEETQVEEEEEEKLTIYHINKRRRSMKEKLPQRRRSRENQWRNENEAKSPFCDIPSRGNLFLVNEEKAATWLKMKWRSQLKRKLKWLTAYFSYKCWEIEIFSLQCEMACLNRESFLYFGENWKLISCVKEAAGREAKWRETVKPADSHIHMIQRERLFCREAIERREAIHSSPSVSF